MLTCICLIDGCLSGEKSRDSDTHTKSITRPCNIKSLHVMSQRDNTMRIRQRAYRNTITLIRSRVIRDMITESQFVPRDIGT